jgi:hypothetical protein
MHLAGNMLFLWIYGDNVEHRLGRLKFLLAYLLTGVVATWSFSLLAGGEMTPLVGASGAISGVLGYYFIKFPHNKVKMFVFFFPFLMTTFLWPARWVLGIYVVLDNLLPLLWGSQSGVAHGAHLGGFVAGLFLAKMGEDTLGTWPRWESRRAAQDGGSATDAATLRASRLRQAVAEGDAKTALGMLHQVDSRELISWPPSQCAVLADWLDQAGHGSTAVRLLRSGLAGSAHAPERAEWLLCLGLLRLRQNQPTSAYQHLLDALDSHPEPAIEARAREALRHIDVYRPVR